MPFNFRLYFKDFYFSIFHSKGTPGRLSTKRILLLLFLFFVFPIWNLYIRLGFALDKLLYPAFLDVEFQDPIFIIGNYRSGSTFFHRLLLRDPQFTCLKAWEIYFAPAITHRKLLRWVLKVSKRIGSPVQRFIQWFDKSLNDIYSMHKTGMYTFEQDSQLFYHTWSSYNLFAIFPFPELAKQFIYYDQQVSDQQRVDDFSYYRGVLQRHIFLNPGKIYISKNPDFSPAVGTIQEYFPNAKFINLVRPPEKMIPSLINLWASNWKAYGSPEEPFPMVDLLLEKARHWYHYPHSRLSQLPAERYQVVDFVRFVENPELLFEGLYKTFGFNLTTEYKQILTEETRQNQNYRGNNNYVLSDMGIQAEDIREDFRPLMEQYQINHPTMEKVKASP